MVRCRVFRSVVFRQLWYFLPGHVVFWSVELGFVKAVMLGHVAFWSVEVSCVMSRQSRLFQLGRVPVRYV